MKNRKWCHLAGLLTIVLLSTGCGKQEDTPVVVPELLEPADIAEDTAYAERRDVYQLTSWESSVIPYLEELSFAASGIIEDINVSIGDTVKAGDVLMTLQDGQSSYDALQEQLTELQEQNAAGNHATELDIEISKLSGQDTARQELLFRQQKELQQLEEKYLQEKLAATAETMDYYQIVAPFDGTVAAMSIYEKGAAIAENTPVLALAAEDEKRYLTAAYISDKVAETSERLYAIIGGREYELTYLPYTAGELATMSAKGITPVANYRLEGGEDVALGEYAIVCRLSNLRENVISIPHGAVYVENGEKYVYVINGDARVRTPIETGVSGVSYVEVVAGLEEGACVYVKN